MDQLKELVYIVNRNKVKQIDLLDLNAVSPSKVNQLYQSISDGAIETDEEAFELLFGKCQSKSAYRNLKHSLRQKLLNTVYRATPLLPLAIVSVLQAGFGLPGGHTAPEVPSVPKWPLIPPFLGLPTLRGAKQYFLMGKWLVIVYQVVKV